MIIRKSQILPYPRYTTTERDLLPTILGYRIENTSTNAVQEYALDGWIDVEYGATSEPAVKEYISLDVEDEIATWDTSESNNATLTLNKEEIELKIENTINGVLCDLYLNIIYDSSITLSTNNPMLNMDFVDGIYKFENNKVILETGKYHIAFKASDSWIHVNIAGYNNLFDNLTSYSDFTNHIEDNNRHLTINTQTIYGVKTYNDIPLLPNENPTKDNQATRKKYVVDTFVSKEHLFDNNDKVKYDLLPDSIIGAVTYKGTWNANTNNPTIPNASSENNGHYYKTTTGGTYNDVEYRIGDWIISDGAVWSKVDNTDNVVTVNGKDGIVTLFGTDINISSTDSTTLKAAIDGKSNTGHVHSATDITSGTLPVSRGGTGTTSGMANYPVVWSGSPLTMGYRSDFLFVNYMGGNSLRIGNAISEVSSPYDGIALRRTNSPTYVGIYGSADATKVIRIGINEDKPEIVYNNGSSRTISFYNSYVSFPDILRYASEPTLSNNNDLVHKKYVDDTILSKKKAEFKTYSASITLALSDAYKDLLVSDTSTITIPSNTSVAFEIGTRINIYRTGTGQITITNASGVTIYGNKYIKTQYRVVQLVKTATNTWYVIGGEA